MSADNQILIASFPTKDGGREWRVAETPAFCDWVLSDERLDLIKKEKENRYCADEIDKEVDLFRWRFFGGKYSFTTEKEAYEYAKKLEEECHKECFVIEYGICSESYNRPLKEDLGYFETNEGKYWLNHG